MQTARALPCRQRWVDPVLWQHQSCFRGGGGGGGGNEEQQFRQAAREAFRARRPPAERLRRPVVRFLIARSPIATYKLSSVTFVAARLNSRPAMMAACKINHYFLVAMSSFVVDLSMLGRLAPGAPGPLAYLAAPRALADKKDEFRGGACSRGQAAGSCSCGAHSLRLVGRRLSGELEPDSLHLDRQRAGVFAFPFHSPDPRLGWRAGRASARACHCSRAARQWHGNERAGGNKKSAARRRRPSAPTSAHRRAAKANRMGACLQAAPRHHRKGHPLGRSQRGPAKGSGALDAGQVGRHQVWPSSASATGAPVRLVCGRAAPAPAPTTASRRPQRSSWCASVALSDQIAGGCRPLRFFSLAGHEPRDSSSAATLACKKGAEQRGSRVWVVERASERASEHVLEIH